jgi:phosphoglycerol transferase MdoB-like AlkP superfamily enzyme
MRTTLEDSTVSRTLKRPSDLLRSLAPGLMLMLAWTVLFVIFRGILIAATWYLRGEVTAGLIVGSFVHGLRFDFAMAATLGAPFALWAIWRSSAGRGERGIVLVSFAILALVSIFAMTAEIEYYKEFEMRLGPLAFQFFGKPEDNKIIFGMIWHGYPVVRWMLACVAIWAAFVWVGRSILGKTSGRIGWMPRLGGTVILAFLSVMMARGGLGSSPLRWGDAFFSQSTYANQMAGNGVFLLVNTLRSMSTGTNSSKWLKKMPPEEAFAIVREITLLPGETLLEPATYPLLRRSPATGAPVAKRPKNVVVVIMESFSARFCGATGASFGATPQFDALAQNGILFDHAFSVSSHTAQGVFGTLCSFPNMPEYDGIMKHPLGMQPFLTLPGILGKRGFQNVFLYNGLFSWDNKEGFFRGQGVQRFIGRYDYVKPTFVDPDWGVSDLDVFLRAIQEFSDMAASGEPFLGLVLTLSNHAPFNLPHVDGLDNITGGGQQNERLNGVHYADWALGQFMDAARKCSWFDETLFVFTGDHGFAVPPVLTAVNLLGEHVPLLFYGPAVFGRHTELRHDVAGQLDILPTILGILGVDVPHQAFGRNLLRLPAGDPGHAWIKRSGDPVVGYVEGDELVTAGPGLKATCHRFDLSFPPSATEDLTGENPERTKTLQRRLNALVVTGITLLEKHLAAPKP